MKNVLKGFTLVELIIVITILAILGSIAFVSFQGYTKNTRDSNRLSTMNALEKGLQIFQINSGKYPEAEEYTEIQASGATIGYQGIVGENISRLINMNSIPKDPKTGENYVYYTNLNKSKFQIMGFMEGDEYLSFLPVQKTYANNIKRLPKVKGDPLGIVLDENNYPVKGSVVDVITTNSKYNVYFKDNDILSGTGETLKILNLGGNLAYGLVGYWTFDEKESETKVRASINKSDIKETNLISGVTLTGGKIGNAIYLSGQTLSGFILDGGFGMDDFENGFTFSIWTKSLRNLGEYVISTPIFRYHNSPGCFQPRIITYQTHLENLKTSKFELDKGYFYALINQCAGKYDFSDGNFHLHTFKFDKGKFYTYIDGINVFSQDFSTMQKSFVIKNTNYYTGTILNNLIGNLPIGQINPSRVDGYANNYDYEKSTSFDNFNLNLGMNRFNGYIDELRIYNRALSDDEIKQLYNSTK